MNIYHKEEESLKITTLRANIKFKLDELGYKSEWSRFSADVLCDFKEEYPKQDADDVGRLAEKIRKCLNDEKRKNLEFLEKLYKVITEKKESMKFDEIPNDLGNSSNDDISKLCRKYLNNFLNKDFLIPDKELNAILYSASIGHKLALRTLGDYYYYGGKFNIPNFIEAHRYYVLAVEKECYISAYQLATMYENENGFIDHKQIAYKYYELSLNFYFLDIVKSIAKNIEENTLPFFPNVFKKVAYYLGFLKKDIDNQGFLVVSYLGFKSNDFICSLYYAYALYVGKGIEQDMSKAISIYEELVNKESSRGYLYICLMCRLATIYRDITNEKDKYEKIKNKIRETLSFQKRSEDELVFYIECNAGIMHPTKIHEYLQNAASDIWSSNKECTVEYKETIPDCWKVRSTVTIKV